MAASSAAVIEDLNVSDMFDDALQICDEIQESSEPNSSSTIQGLVKRAIGLLEEATKIVSLVGMFSTNETVEEVATNEIKFFLLPSLLGTLTLKLCYSDRLEVVNTAEVYFKDFLRRCKSYEIIDFNAPESKTEITMITTPNPATAITDLVSKRNTKIQRFKERKELEGKISLLKENMRESTQDDDLKRDFHLTLIKRCSIEAVEELDAIEAERPMIEHMMKMRQGGTLAEEEAKEKMKNQPPSKPLRPIIITRDEIQKAIYGAGYPSLPTMTVQEFYDQRVKAGEFPDPQGNKAAVLSAWSAEEAAEVKKNHEEAELEQKVERDDETELVRKRAMDDYKDVHRRGDGNRMNRS